MGFGGTQYLAFPDQNNMLLDRHEGPWEHMGRRQTEVTAGTASYVLWSWKNPHPEITIKHIEIVPTGVVFILAGITLGNLDEHPFPRQPRKPVKLSLADPKAASKPFDLEVEVNDVEVALFLACSMSQQEIDGEWLKDVVHRRRFKAGARPGLTCKAITAGSAGRQADSQAGRWAGQPMTSGQSVDSPNHLDSAWTVHIIPESTPIPAGGQCRLAQDVAVRSQKANGLRRQARTPPTTSQLIIHATLGTGGFIRSGPGRAEPAVDSPEDAQGTHPIRESNPGDPGVDPVHSGACGRRSGRVIPGVVQAREFYVLESDARRN